MAFVEFPFPVGGLNKMTSPEDKPPIMSGYMNNVRPFDVLEHRIRGGQRPGLDKAYETQIAAVSTPVLILMSVTVIE